MEKDHPHLAEWKRSEIWLFVATAIFVLASRLPWIWAGPGNDADSFRVFNVAKSLVESGIYSYSRPPGYPAHEFLTAALVRLGPAGTNLLSAAFSVLAFVFLALILRRSGVRPYLLGSLAFALTPVVYINSTSTIDYVPAVAAVLAATYFVLSRRFILAGVCLGLAIGFRITSGAMLVPLVLWIILESDKDTAIHSILRLVAAMLLTATICFTPVLYQYGLGFFTFADNIGYPFWQTLWTKGVLSVWGSIGVYALIGLCCASLVYIRRIRLQLAAPRVLALVLLAIVAITIYVAAFLRLPQEAGYLVPLVPFTIMFFGLILPPTSMRLFSLPLLLSSFVAIGSNGITLDGPVLQDHRKRFFSHELTRAVVATVNQLPATTIVVAGWNLPGIKTHLESDRQNQYIYLIQNMDICEKYHNEGRKLYFLPGIDDFNWRAHGIDLRQCHAEPLKIMGLKTIAPG